MPRLNTLLGTQLHYPRGTDTAAANTIFFADGAGGGSFQTLPDSAPPIVKFKIADDVVTNTTTPVSDTHLVGIELEASASYLVEGAIRFDSADGLTGATVVFQLVSGSLSDSNVTWVALRTDDNITTTGGQTVITTATIAAPGATDQVEVTVSGYLTTTTASTLGVQIAQDVAAATDTTFRKGSWLKFTKQV